MRMPAVDPAARHFGGSDMADDARAHRLRLPMIRQSPLGLFHRVQQCGERVVSAVASGKGQHDRVQTLRTRPREQRIQLAAPRL